MTSKRLLIYLSSQELSQASWVRLDDAGVMEDIVLNGNITDLSRYHVGYDVTVIIPGQEVLLTKAVLPKLPRQRLLQALPYTLEEQLIEDVHYLHFAIGEYQDDGTLPVAIIKHQLIETYLAILKQVSITPTRMIPATLAMPYIPNQWQIGILQDICLVRTEKYQGFACDHENIKTLLKLQVEVAQPQPECIQLYNFLSTNPDVALSDIAINEISYAKRSVLEAMADWIHTHNPSINLLQHRYTSKQPSSLIKKVWIASGYIMGAWLLLLFLNHTVSYVILKRTFNTSEVAIETIYKKHFPNATSIVAPKARMEEKLRKFSTDTNKNYILNLISMIGESLKETSAIRLQQFDCRENSMNLTITAPSFELLDHFSKSLKQQGLMVKQQNAAITDNQVKASLIIRIGVV